jgi:hypothetical protein
MGLFRRPPALLGHTKATRMSTNTLRETASEALQAKAARDQQQREDEAREAVAAPGDAAAAAEAEALERDRAMAAAVEDGIREQTAITFGTLLPSPTFAAQQCLGQERGKVFSIGRITGTVISTERKQTMFGGKLLESVALLGDFHAKSEHLAGILHGSMLFLTNTYSQQIERALANSRETGEMVAIDVDVGFESTGKATTPYAWVITHYLSGAPSRAVRELLAPRKKWSPGAPALPSAPPRDLLENLSGKVIDATATEIEPIQDEVDRVLAGTRA